MGDWIDITLPLAEGLPPWPGDRPFHREIVSEIGVGLAEHNLSVLSMSAHTGTHLDAPLHFIAGGAAVDGLDLDMLIGPAFVLDLTGNTAHISVADLRGGIPAGTLRLLIKTRNSRFLFDGMFHVDFIALTAPAAAYIAASGVRLLGLDAYSIAPYEAPAEAHRAFLGVPGTAALENVDLAKVGEGWYDLICLPLRIAVGEGSPARALLRKREGSGT